jgi:predicted deacylase
MRDDFELAGQRVKAGQRQVANLPLPHLNNHSQMVMPVHIVHGRRPGPVVFLTAAVHGDELNGIEIIRRVLKKRGLSRLAGTLVAIPVVNTYGLIQTSRYLPDRRDLNRSFPGSEKGSLAGRLAKLLSTEVLAKCTHGIDLHTGAIHRSNLPQIRADLDDPVTLAMAEAFGVPVLLNASLRDGSMRAECKEKGIPVLLYEAGEALRYDDIAIRAGVTGVMNVLRHLDMLPESRRKPVAYEPYIARKSVWMRAPESGMMRLTAKQGAYVKKGAVLGFIDDPYSGNEMVITSSVEGVVIGRLEMPTVHAGDAIVHIACFEESLIDVVEEVESFQSDYIDDLE